MSQNSAPVPPGDVLVSQEDVHATDYTMDHLRYEGGNGDEFASEDGYSCEGDYYSDVDVSGIDISESGGSTSGISESDDRAALCGVPDYTDEPEPPNPTQVAGQTTLFQSFGGRGIKPASRAHSPDRYSAIEEQRARRQAEEKQAHPERFKSSKQQKVDRVAEKREQVRVHQV